MASTTSDADRVARTMRDIFSDSDPNNRANSLRSLFAETLDFTPEQGTIPIDANNGLPQSAHRIATRAGITVAYIAISDPGKTRVNKSDAIAVAKSIKRITHDDLFMVFSNGPNDRLEFVWSLQMEGREELRKIVINREMPELAAPQLIADIYARTKASGSVHYALQQVFTQPVVPENPKDIFMPYRWPLEDIYTELADETGTQTKYQLWLDMLRGSGCAPDSKDEQVQLFLSHTLLVTIARAVIATVNNWPLEDPVSVMAEGFASWPQNRNERGPTHTAGVEWTLKVFHTAATRDWRPRTRDVLRNIYQDLIPKDQRKAFGEYYTPDWLASMLVERVIDDEWIERAVERHLYNSDIPTRIGILDPACGSGTFLYHATQRILNSEVLQRQNATPEQQADFIARMINGIDIHPIAIEISRATLMRALPAEPTDGIESLHIYQGDSLIYTHRGTELENSEGLQYHTLLSAGGATHHRRDLLIPKQWAARPGFGQKVMRFVSAANQGEQMPSDIADGLLEEDWDTLEYTYRTLQEVCREEGNSVWAWYIFNSVSPATLKDRKVDRIVTNPPWVRMSNIQVESRKRELEKLVTDMDLWPKRHTGFDIAGMFVTRCRELYLSSRESENDNRAAWVLNSAAIKGDNWQKVRSKSKIWNEEFIDFGELKESPFTGAKSCALIQGVAQTEREPAQTKMINLDKQRVYRSDNLATARVKSEIVQKPREFVPKRSEYFTGQKPDFRQGPILVPHSLVKVAEITAIKNGRVSFVTANSRHGPWTAFNGTLGEVPESYIVDTIFANDLLAFAVRKRTTQVIIPLTKDGNLDSERDKEPYWNYADASYQANRGKGKSTPQNLWNFLNFFNHLVHQVVQWQQAAGSRQQAAGSRQRSCTTHLANICAHLGQSHAT